MNRAAAGRFAADLCRRCWRIVRHPRAEWDALRAQNRAWWAILLGHVLPLSFLPGLGWAAGLALSGRLTDGTQSIGLAFALSVVATVLLSVLCVVVLALGFYLLAPMYETERDWNRAFSVAGYGTTPVLLAGALLVIPIMVMGSMAAMLHCFVLYYTGLQRISGCRPSDAAEYVAISCLLAAVVSGAAGALGGALGFP